MTELGTTRGGNASSIIAACIVAAGLIGAALIVAHRPQVSATASARMVTPPIAQESARTQFRSQVLAAPTLHTFSYEGTLHTVADVKVTQVIYTPKDDTFTISYDWMWDPAMPKDGPQSQYATLSNDGYSHYYGEAMIGASYEDGPRADVTLR